MLCLPRNSPNILISITLTSLESQCYAYQDIRWISWGERQGRQFWDTSVEYCNNLQRQSPWSAVVPTRVGSCSEDSLEQWSKTNFCPSHQPTCQRKLFEPHGSKDLWGILCSLKIQIIFRGLLGKPCSSLSDWMCSVTLLGLEAILS